MSEKDAYCKNCSYFNSYSFGEQMGECLAPIPIWVMDETNREMTPDTKADYCDLFELRIDHEESKIPVNKEDADKCLF